MILFLQYHSQSKYRYLILKYFMQYTVHRLKQKNGLAIVYLVINADINLRFLCWLFPVTSFYIMTRDFINWMSYCKIWVREQCILYCFWIDHHPPPPFKLYKFMRNFWCQKGYLHFTLTFFPRRSLQVISSMAVDQISVNT